MEIEISYSCPVIFDIPIGRNFRLLKMEIEIDSTAPDPVTNLHVEILGS